MFFSISVSWNKNNVIICDDKSLFFTIKLHYGLFFFVKTEFCWNKQIAYRDKYMFKKQEIVICRLYFLNRLE